MHRVHWVDPDFGVHWGLGFFVWRDDGETFVGHGGSCPGYRSQLLLQPRARVATAFAANALGVDSRGFAQTMYDVMAPALKEAAETPGEGRAPDPKLLDYVGAYDQSPWWGETAVLVWKGALHTLSLPTDDPLGGLTKLRHVEGDTFRRVRDDGALGEPFVFERDADGRVVRLWRHGNYDPRLPDPDDGSGEQKR